MDAGGRAAAAVHVEAEAEHAGEAAAPLRSVAAHFCCAEGALVDEAEEEEDEEAAGTLRTT